MTKKIDPWNLEKLEDVRERPGPVVKKTQYGCLVSGIEKETPKEPIHWTEKPAAWVRPPVPYLETQDSWEVPTNTPPTRRGKAKGSKGVGLKLVKARLIHLQVLCLRLGPKRRQQKKV